MDIKEASPYGEVYLAAFGHFMSPERNRAEANFVLEAMDLKSGDVIVDIGCGHGRHGMIWRDFGIHVVGVDIEKYPLRLQKDQCCNQAQCILVMANMLALPFTEVPAMVAISSWGLMSTKMSTKENTYAMREIYRSLRKGGRLLITTLGLGSILPDPFSQTEFTTPSGLWVKETRWFDHLTHMCLTEIQVKRRQEIYVLRHSVRIYTPPELIEMLTNIGFTIQNIWGDVSGSAVTWDSKELVLLCCK